MNEGQTKCPHCAGKGFKLVKILVWVGEQRCGWCKGTGQILAPPTTAEEARVRLQRAGYVPLVQATPSAGSEMPLGAGGVPRCNWTPLDGDYSDMDRGIRYAVKVLADAGIETYESCSAAPGHCFFEPTVRFHGTASDGYRAVAIALTFALPVSELRRFWSVNSGELDGPSWEMTFARERLAAVQRMAEESGLVPATESALDRIISLGGGGGSSSKPPSAHKEHNVGDERAADGNRELKD